MTRTLATLLGLAAAAGVGRADDPRPIPLTRPEMKQLLEDMKGRTPRIPLPPLTDAEKARLGEREAGYESRLRALYLGGGDGRGGFGGGGGAGFGKDSPEATLDYKFKTQLFWIVSRANNCQYCLGHQESKLLSAGMTEDEIAALDGDWADLPPHRRAAYVFARQYTYEPHTLSDASIDAVRKHYTDAQILEMILSMAGNNQINRWKEGVGVPQSKNGGGFGRRGEKGERPAAPPKDEHQTYLTPTSDAYKAKVTKVAPVTADPKSGEPTRLTVCVRPPLESRAEVEKALAAARSRKPRLPVADEAKAKAALGDDAPAGPLPQWVRLLATGGAAGKGRLSTTRAAEEKGDLSPLLKAQVSWIIARQDRAWYATGLAKKRLTELGQTDDQIYALDGDWAGFGERERALFTVAKKLAASPVVLTDDEVAAALKLAGPRDVVQLISYTTVWAAFDRVTESAGLTVEP
ncbi:MAG: hypothetical protein U0871_19155 [Gemmataceae bacterium]